ncbi:hypothetical protein B0J11DRAFT_531082 [Dendryphion nanum]|uniref:Uncharacterized protein n=1 Tax=Dendryphion nanum TaxID=256645 RepID=A0A9P9IK18_9PLEO|nr:hypothetical protein B0J11DRAFT_531082 [Dendryphion nanum]
MSMSMSMSPCRAPAGRGWQGWQGFIIIRASPEAASSSSSPSLLVRGLCASGANGASGAAPKLQAASPSGCYNLHANKTNKRPSNRPPVARQAGRLVRSTEETGKQGPRNSERRLSRWTQDMSGRRASWNFGGPLRKRNKCAPWTTVGCGLPGVRRARKTTLEAGRAVSYSTHSLGGVKRRRLEDGWWGGEHGRACGCDFARCEA